MLKKLMSASLLPLLAVAILATGIGCVHARHEARKLFVELQDLKRTHDELEIEWGQLRIEQSTLASHARVENMAREELQMIEPEQQTIMAIAK